MAITESERLIQISDEIVRRAEIICKITNPSKSTGDRDKKNGSGYEKTCRAGGTSD